MVYGTVMIYKRATYLGWLVTDDDVEQMLWVNTDCESFEAFKKELGVRAGATVHKAMHKTTIVRSK